MPNPYSTDLRKRVIDYVLAGNQILAASQLFQISRNTVGRWLKLFNTIGNLEPKIAPAIRKGYKLNHQDVTEYFLKNPDATLLEAANAFSTHPSTIFYICKKTKFTRKKRSRITKKEMIKNEKNS